MAGTGKIALRAMTDQDLDDVLKVEFLSYAFPWSRRIFEDCIASGYDCRILCVNDEIVGHAVLSVAVGEAHLLNICVRRDMQGRGYGRLFVRQVIKRAVMLGANQLFLEVRPSNRIAIKLYDSLGFVQIGERKDYYQSDSGREDAQVLVLELAEIQ